MSNVKATLLLKERHAIDERSFAELRVWRVTEPLRGSEHHFKYRLAFIVKGHCILRYDNEQGKGDHYHIGDVEKPYAFSTPEQLIADFWQHIDQWRTS